MSFPYYKNAAGMRHLFCVELIDHLWVSHYLNYVALLFMTMTGLGIARMFFCSFQQSFIDLHLFSKNTFKHLKFWMQF